MRRLARARRLLLLAVVLGTSLGGAARLMGAPGAARAIWAATTAVALVPLAASIAWDLLHRRTGVDVIALLAMSGALLLGQYLAGAVIALMLTGGEALEGHASARARRDLSALLARAPRIVHRYEDGCLRSAEVADVRPGDLLLVKQGEIVPVDGVVTSAGAVIDESALTGEPGPVERETGERVSSGTANAGGGFDMRAVARAEESTYAGLVRLVAEAEDSKAPFVRVADRYALVFLPLTLVIAAAAWLTSGNPVRALAVLVVATPCPLILAAPVAIVAGISRAARRGIIVKGGAALEALAGARTLLLDKTGTLTAGMPEVSSVVAFGGFDPEELLRLAASLDQVSPHVLASAVAKAARERHLRLRFPSAVVEVPGKGIEGTVDGHAVALGRSDWVVRTQSLPPDVLDVRRRAAVEGSSNIFVAVDGAHAGALLVDDPIRPDTPRTIRALRRSGIERVVLVTGDRTEVAETVGAAIGADRVLAERSPSDKVDAVRAESVEGATVMVGDGINDAPALAAASVGVALGARGASVSSDAADVVLVPDRLDRLAEALRIAQRSRTIAVQSVLAGMGLSVAAMGFAAAGLLAPVAGAFLQEAIDVAVILNALRALRGEERGRPAAPAMVEMGERLRAEHRELLPGLSKVRSVADRLDTLASGAARTELEEVRRLLVDRLLPHEAAEDSAFYPAVARMLGGDDPTGTMTRAHVEIAHLVRLYEKLLDRLPPSGPSPEDVRDLRRVLYGLHAILRLHFAQEDEEYLSLIEGPAPIEAGAGKEG